MAEYTMKMVSLRIRIRTTVPIALVLASLTSEFVAAQSSREDWQQFSSRVDFELRLGHSLEDAPLTAEDSEQILVRGPLRFCSPTGNCPLWVCMRQRGKARLILNEEGKALVAGDGSYQGFTDLVAPLH